MGGTYNGQPMACAAALAVFDVIEEEKLLERGVAMGRRIERRFKAMADRFPFVGDERGLGPFRGVELVKDKKTKEPITSEQAYGLLTACAERGLIILKAGLYNNVLRTMIPLVASDEELDRGLDVLETVFAGFKP
jgi:4-aminobutyrate aminotransferase/(S)-3-amino-2-methylpropionate transaminase